MQRRVLLIVDGWFVPEALKPREPVGTVDVDLLPFTSDWALVEETVSALREKGAATNCLNAGRLVDEQVNAIRSRVGPWAAALGRKQIGGRSFREWLLTRDGKVSTWWFGVLSQRNPTKTDLFLKLAQAQCVDRILEEGTYQSIWICLSDTKLREVIAEIACDRGVSAWKASRRASRGDMRKRLRDLLLETGIIGDMIRAGKCLLVQFAKGVTVRRKLRNRGSGGRPPNSVLFVTYFPALEREALESGKFRNKYALRLQDQLLEQGRPVRWLLMYVSDLDGYSFRDSVQAAAKLAEHGERLSFVQEFLKLAAVGRVLKQYILQLRIYLVLRRRVTGRFLFEGLSIAPCEALIEPLFRDSFCGAFSMAGIVYYEAFKSALEDSPECSTCIYYMEMQAWEKALNAAARSLASRPTLIGFQHGAIFLNMFHYFHHASETGQSGAATDLPLPDVVACNGSLPRALMEPCGYPGLMEVEALRYLYVARFLEQMYAKPQTPVLLVAGTGYADETTSLLSLLYAALPRRTSICVWIKPHPSQSVLPLLERMNVNLEEAGYRIVEQPIPDLFPDVTAVMTASSSISVEALAFGCEVIVPFLSDYICMNPLVGICDYYHPVYTPQDLREVLGQIRRGRRRGTVGEYREMVRRYWSLDDDLTTWKSLIAV